MTMDDAITLNDAQAITLTPLTLSSFLQKVTGVIKSNFSDTYWIQIEVSKFTDRGSGAHAYFDFVEYDLAGKEVAKARGSLWSGKKTKLLAKFKEATGSDIQDGMKLLLKLSASFSAQYGFSFVVEDIDPSYTLGDMEAKLKAIRKTLIDAMHYDKNKNLPKPLEFTRIAVISPSGAAGLADFMREADALQSHGLCEFTYYESIFQGKDAPSLISSTLRKVFASHKVVQFDALVIIRGGGASSDLAWLNDAELASLVCRIPIPVFTGIGHQIDNTILDEVANARFDTPSKVSAYIAGVIVRNAEAAINDMLAINKGSKHSVEMAESKLEAAIKEVQTLAMQSIHKSEAEMKSNIERINIFSVAGIEAIDHNLNTLLSKISVSANNELELTSKSLAHMLSEVIGLSPKNTLARGYAIVRDGAGKVLTSVDNIKSADNIELEMRDGRFKLKGNK